MALAPIGLDSAAGQIDNDSMKAIPGRVKNGVVVLKKGTRLPEGTLVTVSCVVDVRQKPGKRKRVKLPLVESKRPGTLHLTNQRIAEILAEEDVRSYSKFFLKHKKS